MVYSPPASLFTPVECVANNDAYLVCLRHPLTTEETLKHSFPLEKCQHRGNPNFICNMHSAMHSNFEFCDIPKIALDKVAG